MVYSSVGGDLRWTHQLGTVDRLLSAITIGALFQVSDLNLRWASYAAQADEAE